MNQRGRVPAPDSRDTLGGGDTLGVAVETLYARTDCKRHGAFRGVQPASGCA